MKLKICYSLLCFGLVACQGKINDTYIVVNENGIPKYINTFPKYRDSNAIELKELIQIKSTDEFSFQLIYSIDIDYDHNIYLLDALESDIKIFNKDGQFIKKLGGAGNGPQELRMAASISIWGSQINILELPNKIKIWDLDGKYMSKNTFEFGSYAKIKKTGANNLVVLKRTSFQDRKGTTFSISVHFSDKINEILNEDISYFTQPMYDFVKAIKFTDNHIILADNPTELKINVFNYRGEKESIIFADYNRKKLSQEAKDEYNKNFKSSIESGRMPLNPEYPPIVRKIMTDERGFLWIITGEIWEDSYLNLNDYEVQIFNEKGEWLNTFYTDKISIQSDIIGNRLITPNNPVDPNESPSVYIYDIIYNF